MKESQVKKTADSSVEWEFLIKLLNDKNNVNELLREHGKKMNWTEFMHLVQFHKIYPVIYLLLKTSMYVPNNVKELLHHLYMKNTMEMLNLTREMDQINRALQEAEIRVLMLKGPALSYELYGDLCSRTSKDLDILISFNDLRKTLEILYLLGYENGYEPPRKIKNWHKKVHHLELMNKETNCKVEIHWALHPGPSLEPDFNTLWKRRKTIHITETPIFSLENEILFYYLITHGARHGWFRIRWLMDIVQILKKNVRYEECPQVMKDNKVVHLYGQCLCLMEILELYHLNNKKRIYTKKEEKLATSAISFIKEKIHFYSPPSREWEKEVKKYLFDIKPFMQKNLYIIWKFKANSWDAEILPLPPVLHFLYVPLRPFLWLWRAVTKQKVSIRRL